MMIWQISLSLNFFTLMLLILKRFVDCTCNCFSSVPGLCLCHVYLAEGNFDYAFYWSVHVSSDFWTGYCHVCEFAWRICYCWYSLIEEIGLQFVFISQFLSSTWITWFYLLRYGHFRHYEAYPTWCLYCVCWPSS